MNYKSDIGKIYDTIFFFLEYFNKTEVEDKYIKLFDDTDFMVECYREVADTMNEVPAILQPFFICVMVYDLQSQVFSRRR